MRPKIAPWRRALSRCRVPLVHPSIALGSVSRQGSVLNPGDHNGGLVAWSYFEAAVIEVSEAAVRLERDLFEKLGSYPIDRAALR